MWICLGVVLRCLMNRCCSWCVLRLSFVVRLVIGCFCRKFFWISVSVCCMVCLVSVCCVCGVNFGW